MSEGSFECGYTHTAEFTGLPEDDLNAINKWPLGNFMRLH